MAQQKSTLRVSLRSALSHKKLADDVLDSLKEIQDKFNLTMDKLDADGGIVAATGTWDITTDIILTSAVAGAPRNTDTVTLQVIAATDNPTDTILAVWSGTAAAIVCTVTPNDGTNNPDAAATGTLDITADIILTSVAAGTGRNTDTLTIEVIAAAANPTDTILAVWSGTAAAIVCTITPNDGTNNGATAVDMTTAELREYITTGDIAAKTGQVTETDGSGFRVLQTATGGDATNLIDSGEGDGVIAAFSGGTDIIVDMTTAELVEYINTGDIAAKTGQVSETDASGFRNDQTATGGDATVLVDSGEGDGEVATFAGGVDAGSGLDTDYVAAARSIATPLLSSDTAGTDAQHASSFRRSLQSALNHRRLANEILDSLEEMQVLQDALLAKLDAEAGVLNDTNYESTLAVVVALPDATDVAGDAHKATLRQSLRSALSHSRLADQILDPIVALQAAYNSALVQLDLNLTNSLMAGFKVTAIDPDAL